MRIALCLHGLVGSKSSKYGGNDNINIDIPYKFLKKNLLNSTNNKIDVFLHTVLRRKEKIIKII